MARARQKKIASDYGYNISGPALKDKLFFWWNQEWNKEIRRHIVRNLCSYRWRGMGDFSGHGGTGNADQCGATIPTIPAFRPGTRQSVQDRESGRGWIY